MCGGCRARAYGMTGDVMAEDPLCTPPAGHASGRRRPPVDPQAVEYGQPVRHAELAWERRRPRAHAEIPAFVRGMVTRAVEDRAGRTESCRVTPEQLDKIRERMPTRKMFG